ncbi:MAG: hypothetical protein Q9N34_03330 [Aquificota bacterium]|nr:hypothetical protein [Aquificota bacterium]
MSVRPQYILTGLWVFALSAFCIEHLGIYGRVYPIKEESILERLKSAKPLHIRTEEIEKKLLKAAEVNLGLPVAKALRISEDRLIFKAPRDLRVGSRVIVKKGEEVNVLEKITLSRIYVFLDDYMLKDFVSFAKRYPVTFLITRGNVLSVRRRYPDLTIYMALPVIVERLKIKAVPTVVYQSGDRLIKVEVPWVEGRALLPF